MALERRPGQRVRRDVFGVFPLVPDQPEALHPAVVPRRLRFLIGLRVVRDVIRHVVVFRCVGGEVGTSGRQVVQQSRVGRDEVETEGLVVDLDDFDRLAADHPGRWRDAVQLLVLDDVVDVEHHVVGGEGMAVGPLVTLAQRDGDRAEVVVPFPRLGDVWNQGLEIIAEAHQIDVAPAQNLRGSRFQRLGQTAQHAAVAAALVIGKIDQRLFRHPIADRRERSRRDLIREQRVFRQGQLLADLRLVVGQIELVG